MESVDNAFEMLAGNQQISVETANDVVESLRLVYCCGIFVSNDFVEEQRLSSA